MRKKLNNILSNVVLPTVIGLAIGAFGTTYFIFNIYQLNGANAKWVRANIDKVQIARETDEALQAKAKEIANEMYRERLATDSAELLGN